MVDSIEIYNQAEDLSGRFGTRNPEEIATGLGIMIYEADNFQNLLGNVYRAVEAPHDLYKSNAGILYAADRDRP